MIEAHMPQYVARFHLFQQVPEQNHSMIFFDWLFSQMIVSLLHKPVSIKLEYSI